MPAFVLGYFAYRYSFFRIIINPALFYSALTGIVLTVYLLGIRRVAEQFRDVGGGFRPEIVEATLLTLLVFLFQPVKNRLQRLINRLFFKARFQYQHLLGDLSHRLNVALAFEQRLKDLVDAIGTALKVHVVSLTLFDRRDREDGGIQNISVTGSRGLPGFPPPDIPLSRGPEDKFPCRAGGSMVIEEPAPSGHRRTPPLAFRDPSGRTRRSALCSRVARRSGDRLSLPG